MSFARLARCPLTEMRYRAAQLSRCNAAGFRLPGAPWAFQLARSSMQEEEGFAAPMLKTVGFQRVSELGVDFLVRRSPDSGGGNATVTTFVGAFCYVEGAYPPVEGAVCEQWRGEGVAEEIPVSAIRATAPLPSFAQILACSARGDEGGGEGGGGQRPTLGDRTAFVDEVRALKAQLAAGGVPDNEIEGAVQAFRLRPSRMELLRSGPDIWERFEWQSQASGPSGAGAGVSADADAPPLLWCNPRQLLPY